MNWIKNDVLPKIKGMWGGKRDMPENLWIKCPESGQMVHHSDLEQNLYVIPGSGYHMKMPAEARLKTTFDGEYQMIEDWKAPSDPLKFRDQRKYADRIKDARAKTGQKDAVIAAVGLMGGVETVIAVQNFAFMGGSLGMAAGAAIVRAMEVAVERKAPFIIYAASGGARMQEGILSLMQMPRTTVAVQMLNEACLPYIVVLTDPTTGGVTASYAMLGDIHIAEPNALICFAGPRVIEQTIREKLPRGFQRAEYLEDHGMIDLVVHRHDMRGQLIRLVRMAMKLPPLSETPAGDASVQRKEVPSGAPPEATPEMVGEGGEAETPAEEA
ncbi:MAG: acetyl-CoA carboxylase carboxyl transferase subunit beta [Hyphomicrobiales bacterium]|nr:MAG: acetyl-CoA carboxylase carboxyl transferase subunit beta [Hyphomicrobiales bacterium]